MSALADRILDHPRAVAAAILSAPLLILVGGIVVKLPPAAHVATPVMTGIDDTPIDYGAHVVPVGATVSRYYPGKATIWRDEARGGEWLCNRYDECAFIEWGK